MATHSSALAWRIPGTGEPGGLLSTVSHRVRHDWSDLAAAAAAALWLRHDFYYMTVKIKLSYLQMIERNGINCYNGIINDLAPVL